jgi:ABC-type transport system involved in multi-copper enzyme maturation permease subunit
MLNVAFHFVIGSVVSLLMFLVFARLSGVRSFSAPSAVLFIGFTCALLSHFVSPWATPLVLLLYGVASAIECRNDRIAAKRDSSESARP